MLYRGKRYAALASPELPGEAAAYDLIRRDPEYDGSWGMRHVEQALRADDPDGAAAAFADRYAEAVAWFEALRLDTCWRMLRLPADTDPATVDPLGTDWSVTRSTATGYRAPYGGEGSLDVRYRADASSGTIDATKTLLRRIAFPDEDEIDFVPGSRIFVYAAELLRREGWRKEPEPLNGEVRIDAWRMI